jgi:hypothetical protein
MTPEMRIDSEEGFESAFKAQIGPKSRRQRTFNAQGALSAPREAQR